MINWKLVEDKTYPEINNLRRIKYEGKRYKIIINHRYNSKSVYKMLLDQPRGIFIGIGFELNKKKRRGRPRNR